MDKPTRRKRGQSLLEATFGLIIIVGVVLSLIDLAIVLYGVSLNDSSCRNAACAAAAGDTDEAESRAQVAITQSSKGEFGAVLSHPKLLLPIEVDIASQPEPRRDPETGRVYNPGGLVTGSVTVKTEVEVKPFAMDFLLRRKEPFVFRSNHSFPIHYVIPAS